MKWMISLLILISSFEALAGLKMFIWEPGTTLAPLVLFVKDGETPEQAAIRYLQNLERDPGMMELFFGKAPYLPLQGFRELKSDELKASILLMANNASDYTLKSIRLKQFNDVFEKAQSKILILPMMPTAGLDFKASKEARAMIADSFPMLVAMGGEDVAPELYGKEHTLSRDTIRSRDISEISVIREFIHRAKGFMLGICRGHQITSVAMGYRLMQDIPVLVENASEHANNFHKIQVLPTSHQLLSSLFPNGSADVNSYHHQAVIYKDGGPLQIAARGEDGVTEALEFRNGQGLLLQFHPESMGIPAGQRIIDHIVQAAGRRSIYSCGKIHRI